ncbi:MAG: hypothetical protein M1838_003430 [Thelocarpon superellum]|nr:MAG: hypothetical protein M1838_003430 [Thelocarpon superellum]
MTAAEADRRAEDLATQALQLVNSGHAVEGARTLRDAVTLSVNNVRVKAAFEQIQHDQSIHPLSRLCRSFAVDHDEAAGQEALEYLQRSDVAIPRHVGETCVKLLLDHLTRISSYDQIVSMVLRQSLGARAVLAKRLEMGTTNELFEKFWVVGDASSNALVQTVLDAAAWDSQSTRVQCEKNVFMLLLANLLSAGQDDGGRPIKGIARLLANDPTQLSPLIDEDCFETIMSHLDFRCSAETRSHATLASAKYLEASPEEGQAVLANYVGHRVANGTDEERIIAFSAAAAVFPLVPTLASGLFMTEGLVESLVRLLQPKTKDPDVIRAALEMFSAACMDQACREAIAKHASTWLQEVVRTDKDYAGIAAVILTKLYGVKEGEKQVPESKEMGELVARFKKTMVKGRESEQSSIEGLAYASLQPQVKEDLSKDEAFLRSLMGKLGDSRPDQSPIVLGGLTIVAHITAYPRRLSEEQKRMVQLKAYANSKKLEVEPDALDSEDRVTARCKAVLDAGIMPPLLSVSRKASPTTMTLIVSILLSLAQEQKHRGYLAQRGAVKLLLQVQTPAFASLTTPQSSYTAAHALARILISVDPSLIFTSSSALPASSAIRPLLPLLSPDPSSASSSAPADLLPTYEALLALTNLASYDMPTAEAISSQMFPVLDTHLLSSNTHLQRASLELVCNTASSIHTISALTASPSLSTITTPSSAEATTTTLAKQRLTVLLALSNAREVGTRRAATGAMAMLSAFWDEALTLAILDNVPRGMELVLAPLKPSLHEDDDDEKQKDEGKREGEGEGEEEGEEDTGVLHRLMTFLHTITSASVASLPSSSTSIAPSSANPSHPSEEGDEAAQPFQTPHLGERTLAALKEAGGVEVLGRVLLRLGNVGQKKKLNGGKQEAEEGEEGTRTEVLRLGITSLKALMSS